MSNNKRVNFLLKNTILFTISSFGSKLISFFLVPLYTNILSTADYGNADLISTSVSLLLFVFTLNISSSVLRFAMDTNEYHEKVLAFGMKVFALGTAGLGILLVLFHTFLQSTWTSRQLFYLFCLFLFSGLNEMFNNYVRARDKVTVVVIASISATLTTVLLNIMLLVVFKWGFDGYMVSIIMGQFLSCAIYVLAIKPHFISAGNLDSTIKQQMMFYSIPLIFNGVAWWINQSLDKYFINGYLGVEENGIYAAAAKIPTILSTFLTIFLQAWGLLAIKEYNKEDSDSFYSEYYNTFNGILILVTSTLIFFNIPLSTILCKKDFFVAWQFSSVLVLAVLFNGLSSFVGSFFSAAKNNTIFAVSTFFAAVVNIVLNYILIPEFGVLGASVATVVSFYFVWMVRIFCTKRIIHLHLHLCNKILCYLLLSLQIFLEHKYIGGYILQFIVFIVLVLLNWKSLLSILRTSKNVIYEFRKKINNQSNHLKGMQN